MARVTPTPIPPHPDLPQRSDRSTFAVRSDAYVDWQANVMAPGIETLAEQTYENAQDAYESAQSAATSATDAADSATEAATSATEAATSATEAATSAAQAEASATSASEDAAATAADRVQTGEDRQAVADMLDDIADGPVASINGKSGVVRLYERDITPLEIVSASTNAVEGKLYGVDTSEGAVTITLPADPVPGTRIPLADVAGVWGDTPPVVARNGNRIMGLEEDMELDIQYLSLALVFVNSSRGWVIV